MLFHHATNDIFLVVVRCNPITFEPFDFKHMPVARTYPLVMKRMIKTQPRYDDPTVFYQESDI